MNIIKICMAVWIKVPWEIMQVKEAWRWKWKGREKGEGIIRIRFSIKGKHLVKPCRSIVKHTIHQMKMHFLQFLLANHPLHSHRMIGITIDSLINIIELTKLMTQSLAIEILNAAPNYFNLFMKQSIRYLTSCKSIKITP